MRSARIFVIPLLLSFTVLLLIYPNISVEAISYGLQICSHSILPVLFPFFILSNLWLQLGFTQYLSRIFSPIMERLFHLPGQVSSALILGAIGGYPVGAYTVADMHLQKKLKKTEAEHALIFCCNAGPAFIFGILSANIFRSPVVGIILWSIHLTSALLLGFLFRPENAVPSQLPQEETESNISIFEMLTNAVSKAGETTLQVCVYILLFSVLTSYLSHWLPTMFQETVWHSLLTGFLELAGGAVALSNSPLSPQTKFIAAVGLLSWGGMCVHCQTLSALFHSGLSAKHYFFGKFMQALLSMAIARLLLPSLPLETTCFAAPSNTISLLPYLFLLFTPLLKSSSGNKA